MLLTKPAKPSTPSVTTGAGDGKLTLSATVLGGDSPLMGWEYTTDDGGTWTSITTARDNNLNYLVTGLDNSTSYRFKVRVVNTTGAGPASDPLLPPHRQMSP